MYLWLEKFLTKGTTVTLFFDVDTPSPGFTTTTVTQAKEELGPGWATDDVYPPLAELRRALLTDEEWAAMSSWEKDVWEVYYRPDWERLACIEQILVETPAAQRAHRHEEILAALRSLGASTSVSVDHLDDSQVVSVDAALSAIVAEGPEDVHSASTSVITTVPFTCSTDCSPEESTAAPVLVAPSPATRTEYVLNSNSIRVSAVPIAVSGEFPAILAPTVFTPTVHLATVDIDPMLAAPATSDGTLDGQAISGIASTPATCLMVCLHRHPEPYNGSEFFMPTSSQCITTKVHVHRPLPWPSFMVVRVDGVEARPLPWPSFREINRCEFPNDFVEKSSWRCNSDSFRAESCAAIEFQISDLCGNLLSSPGYIITHDSYNPSESRYLDYVLLILEYWGSASDCVQLAHTNQTPISWLSCTISEFHWLALVRILELKLLPIPSTFVTLSAVLVDSVNFADLTYEYLVVDTTLCFDPWLFAGCLLAVCQKYSVQSSTDYLIASDYGSRLLITMDCSHLKALVVLNSVNMPASSYDQLSCANQYTSCFPGYPVTSSQLDFVAYSALHRFLSGLLPSCRPTVMFELQISKSDSHCVYLQGLQLDKCGMKGATLNTISISVDHYWLKSSRGLCLTGWRWIKSELKLFSVGPIPETCPAAVCINELECTIGDMETIPFIEASHQLPVSLEVEALVHSTVVCSLKLPVQWVASSDFKDVAATSAPEAHATGQLSVFELYRHDLDLGVAYTQEFNTDTPGRVVLYMPEVPVIIVPECQIVPMSSCEKTQQLGFLLQKGCGDWQFGHSTIDRVQPILLLIHVYHLSYDQTAFQGGRDVIRAAVSDQVLYFTTINVGLIYYREDNYGDSSKSNELQRPWDPGTILSPSLSSEASAWGQAEFKEGGMLATVPVYLMLGCYDGLAPMGRPQFLALLLIHGTRQRKNHPSWIRRTRHGGLLSHLRL